MNNVFEEVMTTESNSLHNEEVELGIDLDLDSITAEAYEGLSNEVESITDTYGQDLNNLNAMLYIDEEFTTENHDKVMTAVLKANGFVNLDFADIHIEEALDTEVVEEEGPKSNPKAVGFHDAKKAEQHKKDSTVDTSVDGEDDYKQPKKESKLKAFANKILRGFLNMVDKLIITIKKWFAKASMFLMKSLDDRKELWKQVEKIGEKEINKIETKDGIASWALGVLSRSIFPALDKVLTSNDMMTLKASTARGIMGMTSEGTQAYLPGNLFVGNVRRQLGLQNAKGMAVGFNGEEAMFAISPGGILTVAPDNTYVTGESNSLGFGMFYISGGLVKQMEKGAPIGHCGGIKMRSMEFYLTLNKKAISKNLDSVTKKIEEHKKDVKAQIEAYEKDPKAGGINTVRLTSLSNRRNAILFKSVSGQIGFVNDAVAMAKFIIKKKG